MAQESEIRYLTAPTIDVKKKKKRRKKIMNKMNLKIL